MARIGLNNLWYAKLSSGGTYGGAISFGKAISCNVSISNNSATLYADDGLAESDTSFQSGTVTLGVDDEGDTTFADILGHTVNASGEVVRNSGDTAPYVALARVVVKMVNNVKKYKAEILYKVKFSEPSQEDSTRGESVEFATPEIEGQISTLDDGKWSTSETFSNKQDCIDYIMGVLGSPVAYDYDEVTSTTGKNPLEEGWFIKNGNIYIRTLDTTPVTNRTYYERTLQ